MRIIALLSISLIISSCIDKYNQYGVFYEEIKKEFGNEFISHFPMKVEGDFSSAIFVSDTFGYNDKTGATMIYKVEDDSLKKLLNNIYTANIYSASDSCLLIVGDKNNNITNGEELFIDMFKTNDEIIQSDTGGRFDSISQANLKILSLPVPNFSMVNYNTLVVTKDNRLTEDFILYVLDAKSGKFLLDKRLSNGYGLPDVWKNGYSKGIAISKKRNLVLYWLEIW
jgi:hypothetical protein